MPKFVYLVTFISSGGKFNERKDSDRINEVLLGMQNHGASIVSVTLSVGGAGTLLDKVFAAVYVIMYEAPRPLFLKF